MTACDPPCSPCGSDKDCWRDVDTARTQPRILADIEQGTPEWDDARRGMVTASVVGQLLTPTLKVASNDTSRALTALLVAERVTGWTDPTYLGADMIRGIEHEPIARKKYAESRGVDVAEVGFMVREFDGFELGCSPDGLVGDDGLIEIKCPRAKTHLRTVIADKVPSHYMAQLQAALLVSGRKWIDYVSFCAGMPLYICRVTPDPKWQDAIVAAVAAFEQAAEQMTSDYLGAVVGLPETERVLEMELP